MPVSGPKRSTSVPTTCSPNPSTNPKSAVSYTTPVLDRLPRRHARPHPKGFSSHLAEREQADGDVVGRGPADHRPTKPRALAAYSGRLATQPGLRIATRTNPVPSPSRRRRGPGDHVLKPPVW